MIIENAQNSDTSELKQIWKNIFCDTDEYIDLFFEKKVRRCNTFIIRKDKKIASMLFIVPEKILDKKSAYICGVATLIEYRGLGYARKLMEYALNFLKLGGYGLAFLIPAGAQLFSFYKKIGFETFSNLKVIKHKKSKNMSNELYSDDFNFDKLSKFYDEFFPIYKPSRNNDNFKTIFDCYKNVRIYENGYIFYYVSQKELYVIEHTFYDALPYIDRLLDDTHTDSAKIYEKTLSDNPFSMVYYFKNEKLPINSTYVNLMLN